MADEFDAGHEASDEELKSKDVDSGSADEESQSKLDYQALYEKSEAERKELASLIGRQGNELGELRKLLQINKTQSLEEDLDDYFDQPTLTAIEKIVEKHVEQRLTVAQQKQQEQELQKEFQIVYNQYDLTEENLNDLAYYAATKKVSIADAAEILSQKGILEKRKKGTTIRTNGAPLASAPTGMPKVASGRTSVSKDPVKMTNSEWNALSDEQRQAALRKVSAS